MIKSFRGKESEKVWRREYSKRIPGNIQERLLMKLQQLNAAGDLKDLSIPSSNQLEALKGDRKGGTASVSTSSGGSVSGGVTGTPSMSRSSIITRRE